MNYNAFKFDFTSKTECHRQDSHPILFSSRCHENQKTNAKKAFQQILIRTQYVGANLDRVEWVQKPGQSFTNCILSDYDYFYFKSL